MTTHATEYTVSLPETWVPIPDDLAVYEPLPQDWYSDDHHYMYGWAVSPSWFETYFAQHRVPFSPGPLMEADAIVHMRRQSLFDGVCIQSAVPDTDTIEKGMVLTSGKAEYVQVLALSCTRNCFFFHRRPSPKAMKKLEELCGAKPRWFKVFEKTEKFDWDTWIY